MKIRKLMAYFCCALKYGAAFWVAPFLRNRAKYRDLWIIAERGTDARDNAYYFFKYVRENHPEINTAYIISKYSSDRVGVEKLGRVIDHNSFEHYIAMVLSKVKISTHIVGYSPNIDFFIRLNRLGLVNGKKIFLQHGITKDNIAYLHNENTGVDLFVCAAKPELDYIQKHYGYPDNVPKLLGFCRYDSLYGKPEKTNKILLMPTWRVTLGGCGEKEFIESVYYKTYQRLINSEKIGALLEEHDCELIFYPHIEMQRFLHCFSGSKRVRIMGFDDTTVQNLLIECDILITDFSSVFFDFGYMEKPIVYYQFDKDEFRKTHYVEGYFSYERDGFGAVTNTEAELTYEIEKLLENGSELEETYRERIHNFFTIRDKDNCKRNFEAAQKIAEGEL